MLKCGFSSNARSSRSCKRRLAVSAPSRPLAVRPRISRRTAWGEGGRSVDGAESEDATLLVRGGDDAIFAGARGDTTLTASVDDAICAGGEARASDGGVAGAGCRGGGASEVLVFTTGAAGCRRRFRSSRPQAASRGRRTRSFARPARIALRHGGRLSPQRLQSR